MGMREKKLFLLEETFFWGNFSFRGQFGKNRLNSGGFIFMNRMLFKALSAKETAFGRSLRGCFWQF